MRISDWSSDVCSSDLTAGMAGLADRTDYHWGQMLKAALISTLLGIGAEFGDSDEDRLVRAIRSGGQDAVNETGRQVVERQRGVHPTIGRASGRERGCQYV